MSGSKKIIKWLGIAIGGVVGLLCLAAVLVPLFVDVDRFRPDIEKAVNDRIVGKFELGKLSLSLWGQIKIQVDGFSLKDKAGSSVVSAQDVYFHIPFISVLTGSPALSFRLRQPELLVVKNANGKLNVLSLMKPQAPAASGASEAAAPSASGGDSGLPKSLPGIVTRARLGMEMLNAHLVYQDKATGLTSEVQALNVIVKDISLSRPMDIEIGATLDTKMGKVFHVKGPLRLNASVSPTFEGAVFKSAAVAFQADADPLVIQVPGTFEKTAQIPAHASGKLTVSATDASIEKMQGVFHNAEVNITGKVSGLASGDPEVAPNPNIQFTVESNQIDLAPWNKLSPLLKEYELSGTASLQAKAWGTSLKPEYDLRLKVENLQAKAPMLKAKPRFDVAVKVVTDKVESMVLQMQAPGTDLAVKGSVISFTKPNANFSVTSKGMDLDQWIEFPKPAKAASGAGAPAPTATTATGKSDAKVPDYDKALDALRENDIAVATRANITVSIPLIKAMNVRISEVASKMAFWDLTAKLESFRLKVFDGAIGAAATVRLKPARPTYDFNVSVAGFDVKKAVTSQLELFKNTLYGNADFKMAGSGASFNPQALMDNLAATGSFQIRNASFASMDIAKLTSGAINKTLSDLGSKFPGVRGKSVKIPEDRESGYEMMNASFTLKKQVFDMPNFSAKVKPNQGVDLNGATTVDIKEQSLKADWQIVDTYNVTQLRNIAIEEQGVRVDPLFAEGAKPVVLPIRVRGKLTGPTVDYTAMPEALAKVAANNIAQAVKGKVEAEAKKRIAEEIQKKAPPQIQKALEGVGKKLKLPF
jgi:hypothetical protein